MLALATALILSVFPAQGEIAFIAHTQDSTRLCIYNVATDAVTELGPRQTDRDPQWSPDGTKIAFTTEIDGKRQVVIAHPAENRVEILNNGKALNHAPRWSPSGKRLVYQSGESPNTTVSVYDLASNVETTWGGDTKGLLRPVWTQTRAFRYSRFLNNERELLGDDQPQERLILAVQLIANSDSSGLTTRLVAVTPDEVLPLAGWVYDYPEGTYLEWSIEPGDRDRALAYESNDGGDRELFVVLEGKVFDVSNHRAADWNPVWSPDATWVAYETFRDQRRAVYRSHRESGRSMPILESGSANFYSPAWHPDSEHLVAIRDKNGAAQMVITSLDGDERKVIKTPFDEISSPQWRPR